MDSEKNVSQTAMLIASLRAMSTYEDDPKIKGNDYLSDIFLPDEKRLPLKAVEFRKSIRGAIPEGLYEYVIARTKYFDDLFLQSLNLKIPQIVLLGAGYDSRAYRFADKIGGASIFEVDMEATQQAKIKVLKENRIKIPEKVKYVSADFEKDDLFKKLTGSGY